MLLKIAKKISGKNDIKLDPCIPKKYLFRIYINYLLQLLRGYRIMPFLKKHGKSLFIGTNTKLYFKKNISFGTGVKLGNYCKIDALSREGVQFGNNSGIGDYSVIECTGSMNNIGKGVKIGKQTNFGSNCFFGAAGGIEIGDDVIGGQNIRFHSEEHNFVNKDILIHKQGVSHKGIKIGDNCWIGAGVVILDGVNIGTGCIIGANSLVNKNIPNYSIYAGNPAKIIKKR